MIGRQDLLDCDLIKRNLRTKRIGREIIVYSQTASTNDIAAQYGKNKKNDGFVVFTEEQTKGRGRTGNKWISGRADSILCSILLTSLDLAPELLSLSSAVAVAETIGKLNSIQSKIKWPNDIFLNGKKVAGILVESKKYNSNTIFVIGIGINCHEQREDFPRELEKTATSIDIESKTVCDRISLARRLLTNFEQWIETAQENHEKVINKWKKLSIQLGHRVSVIYNAKKYSGNCIGIDPEKGLILQLDRGGVRMFDAAHTSIAK